MIPRGWSHVNQAEARELIDDAAIIRRLQHSAKQKVVTSLENNLAVELERRAAEKVRIEQDKIRICDKSEELRALKIKLMEAKTNRERAAQILEKQLRGEEERYRDLLLDERAEEERLHIIEEERAAQLRREYQRRLANDMQKEQIQERERLKEENDQEAEYERKQVDDLVEKLRLEDEQEAIERHNRLMQQRKMLNDFATEKDILRREEQAQQEAELQAIEDFARAKREREERFLEQKRMVEAEKKRIQAQLLHQHADRDRRAAEQEYLINELRREEKEEEERLKDLAAREKALKQKIEMLRCYEDQMAQKEVRKQQEQAEEAAFRREMLAKFAEEDRLEQLTQERKRVKMREHMEKVKELWEVKREMYEKEKAAELAEREKEIEERERELAIIAEARKQLLVEHSDLINFLPPGVLQNEEDAQMVSQAAAQKLNSRYPVNVPMHIDEQPGVDEIFKSKGTTVRSLQAPEVHTDVRRNGTFQYATGNSNTTITSRNPIV